MPETSFKISYDGPGVKDGRIPASQIGKSLTAMSDLFADAGRVVGKDFGPVVLKVEATSEGSFEVQLVLEAGNMLWDTYVNVLGSKEVTALANLPTLVLGAKGLIGFLGRNKGESHEVLEDDGTTVVVQHKDGSTSRIPQETYLLMHDQSVREDVERVVEPLRSNEIEKIEFEADEAEIEVIRTADVPSFAAPARADSPVETKDREVEMLLEITATSFRGGSWRFTDGTRKFPAVIEDEAFQRRIDNHEPFASGDRLRARVRMDQTVVNDKLGVTFAIVEVIDHERQPQYTQMGMIREVDATASTEPPALEAGDDEDDDGS